MFKKVMISFKSDTNCICANETNTQNDDHMNDPRCLKQGRAASEEILAEAVQGVLHLRPKPIQGEQGMLLRILLK